MKFNTLVLDCDGVLCEAWKFSRYLEREYSISPTMTEEFFTGPFVKCLLGECDLKELLPSYLASWGWPDTLDKFLEDWFREDGHVDNHLIEYAATLRKRGIAVYVATNQEKYRTEHLSKVLRFSQHFDGLFSSSMFGAKKPQPEFYRNVTERINTPAERILFWDDSASYLEGARRCGWQVEQFSDFAAFSEKMKIYLD